MTGYDLVAIVNLLEDWNDKDYGFALYKEEYELLRSANLENTLVVVNARSKDRRVLGKVKEILSLKEYGKNPTAQVVGVANMDAYMNRIEEERAKNIEKIKYRIEKKIDDILDGHKDLDNLFKQLKEFESEKEK
ncbi:MAG: hypothetical protein ACLS20_06250 [Faecalimonas umbilicata]|uniref:hypothetical protein n=1 Tax=Faecalimonas umbilicata TaxID=1912855 RepID=UPI003992A413